MKAVREKVVVAMSGGVDSSVAACLLAEQGYEVMGFFMRVGSHEVKEPRREELRLTAASADSEEVLASKATGRRPQAESGPSRPPFRSQTGAPRGSASPPESWTIEQADRSSQAASTVESCTAGQAGLPARSAPPDDRHRGCCSASDAADARYVAGMLNVPFYALNFEQDFEQIIDYFAAEYARGRTPNPCVMCNDRLKFGKLLDYADAVGARYIATGHYARVDRSSGTARLLRAVDARKDQSYVLFGLAREVLERVLFPIGHLMKDEVRSIARTRGFPNCDKADSVEICFVPDRNYTRIVQERRPEVFRAGEVVDQSGMVVGRHNGVPYYTVGQRRGLGIAAGKPVYVTKLDVLNNRVVIGDDHALLAHSLVADRANLLVDDLAGEFRAEVKIRYLHTAVPATVRRLGNTVSVIFDQPQRAVTPGQAAVFYDGDTVLGGAWISQAESTTSSSPSHSRMPM